MRKMLVGCASPMNYLHIPAGFLRWPVQRNLGYDGGPATWLLLAHKVGSGSHGCKGFFFFCGDFQVCMLGATRDKWTRIVGFFPGILALSIK